MKYRGRIKSLCQSTKIPFVFPKTSREEGSRSISLLHYVHPAIQRLCEMIRSDNCVLRCSCPARNASQVTQTPCPHHFSPVLTPSFSLSALISFLSWPALLQPALTTALHPTLWPQRPCSACFCFISQKKLRFGAGWYTSYGLTPVARAGGAPEQPGLQRPLSPLSMASLFSRSQGAAAGRILMYQVSNQINSFAAQ